ncbi:MAG: L-histidine N(alpha)-methyltransferase [Acidimicrobiia bacterium]
MSRPPAALTVEVHLDAADLDAALRADARAGLTATPKRLPPKWFYDARGSELFEQITRLPEYYPTRREREILAREAAAIAERTGVDALVELGSGTSEKTLLLLDAFAARDRLVAFTPFDVCEPVLRDVGPALAARYEGLAVHAIVGDFERHLGHLPVDRPKLVAFLGGTIGNLEPPRRARFLADLRAAVRPGDWLLLGTDLVKDEARLVAAYDDAAGVTAEFDLNVLRVLNAALDGDLRPELFVHEARWNRDERWIEMWLRSTVDQTARLRALDLDVHFTAGEGLWTEVSAKFTREVVVGELDAAGFALDRWMTDAHGDFGLALAAVRP